MVCASVASRKSYSLAKYVCVCVCEEILGVISGIYTDELVGLNTQHDAGFIGESVLLNCVRPRKFFCAPNAYFRVCGKPS